MPASVPRTAVSGASLTARARPKSVILTRSTLFSSMTFAGLMSRCTRPWACAATRPAPDLHADPEGLVNAEWASDLDLLLKRLSLFHILHDEIRRRPSSLTAWMVTTFSWHTTAAARASRVKRRPGFRAIDQLGGEDLDRDHAVETRVERLENETHASPADRVESPRKNRAGPSSSRSYRTG